MKTVGLIKLEVIKFTKVARRTLTRVQCICFSFRLSILLYYLNLEFFYSLFLLMLMCHPSGQVWNKKLSLLASHYVYLYLIS